MWSSSLHHVDDFFVCCLSSPESLEFDFTIKYIVRDEVDFDHDDDDKYESKLVFFLILITYLLFYFFFFLFHLLFSYSYSFIPPSQLLQNLWEYFLVGYFSLSLFLIFPMFMAHTLIVPSLSHTLTYSLSFFFFLYFSHHYNESMDDDDNLNPTLDLASFR